MSPKLDRKSRREITQKVGAKVKSITTGQIGEVTGHYDDDIVFVQMDGEQSPNYWWTNDLRLS